MNSKWTDRLNQARGWIFAAALVVAGVVWLVRH
jgi:hypothetical protein